jgi:hypothetical protein
MVRIAPASSAPSKEDLDFATCHKAFNFLGFMAGAAGLEPATSAVTGRRSNQLNYAPAYLNQQQTGVSVRISNAKANGRSSEGR